MMEWIKLFFFSNSIIFTLRMIRGYDPHVAYIVKDVVEVIQSHTAFHSDVLNN